MKTMITIEKIKKVLQKNNEFGLNITEISKLAGVTRETTVHWLNKLEMSKEVLVHVNGTSKIYKLRKNVLQN
ncbi:MAG: hypothetical protein ABIB47_02335 [Candidatus Woesearchaeota archaeon]